jgi:hypothetical protein
MRRSAVRLACLVGLFAGCHHGLIYDPGPKPSVGGTIAGIAMTTDETVRLPGRKISAIEVTTGSRYDSTTASNGGYTIKVPEGRYRLEIELRAGEALAKRPDQTRVNNGDLDPGRDFVVTVTGERRSRRER